MDKIETLKRIAEAMEKCAFARSTAADEDKRGTEAQRDGRHRLAFDEAAGAWRRIADAWFGHFDPDKIQATKDFKDDESKEAER